MAMVALLLRGLIRLLKELNTGAAVVLVSLHRIS
jgi:hypothetical protein